MLLAQFREGDDIEVHPLWQPVAATKPTANVGIAVKLVLVVVFLVDQSTLFGENLKGIVRSFCYRIDDQALVVPIPIWRKVVVVQFQNVEAEAVASDIPPRVRISYSPGVKKSDLTDPLARLPSVPVFPRSSH